LHRERRAGRDNPQVKAMQNKKQEEIANKVEQMLGPDAAKFFKPNTMTREDIVFVTDVALGYIARVYKA